MQQMVTSHLKNIMQLQRLHKAIQRNNKLLYETISYSCVLHVYCQGDAAANLFFDLCEQGSLARRYPASTEPSITIPGKSQFSADDFLYSIG